MNYDPDRFTAAREGDQQAFWELIVPLRGMIFAVALGTLKNPDQAQDLVQEVYLRAFRSISNVREADRFPAWVYAMTRNAALESIRREQRLRQAANLQAGLAPRIIPVADLLSKEQWLQRMDEALPQLPEPFRIVLALKYTNEHSCREMASILDISVPAVKSRLFEARKLLRKIMEKSAAGEEAQKNGAQ